MTWNTTLPTEPSLAGEFVQEMENLQRFLTSGRRTRISLVPSSDGQTVCTRNGKPGEVPNVRKKNPDIFGTQ